VCSFASAEEFMVGNLDPSCDCIISDMHMPGISGLDLKRQLAAHGCKVPLTMMTASPDEGLEARAEAGGAACLLKKPFESDKLIGWLNKILKC
jgi:FixJ family two-component response regulator